MCFPFCFPFITGSPKEYKECCFSFPHGPWVVSLVISSAIGTGLSIAAPLICDFVTHVVSVTVNVTSYASESDGFETESELITFETRNEHGLIESCSGNEHGTFDGVLDGYFHAVWDMYNHGQEWKAATVFAFLAAVVAAGAMIVLWCGVIFSYGRVTFVVLSSVYAVCVVLEGLTLIVLSSDLCSKKEHVDEYGRDIKISKSCTVTETDPVTGSTNDRPCTWDDFRTDSGATKFLSTSAVQFYNWDGCEIGVGAGLAIGAMLFFFFTSLFILLMFKCSNGNSEQEPGQLMNKPAPQETQSLIAPPQQYAIPPPQTQEQPPQEQTFVAANGATVTRRTYTMPPPGSSHATEDPQSSEAGGEYNNRVEFQNEMSV